MLKFNELNKSKRFSLIILDYYFYNLILYIYNFFNKSIIYFLINPLKICFENLNINGMVCFGQIILKIVYVMNDELFYFKN